METTSSSGTLILASSANDYSGATEIVLCSILQLQTDPDSNSGALLGTGQVTVNGTLDLNDCPLHVGVAERRPLRDDHGYDFRADLGDGLDHRQHLARDVQRLDYRHVYRLVKSGTGELDLGGYSSYTGGTELDAGTVVLESSSALPNGDLVVNGGTLDLNGNSINIASLNGAGGLITDDSTGGGTTTINVGMYQGSHPALFAGSIVELTGANAPIISLVLSGEGLLALTGQNAFTGGTYEEDGWLQIGDGNTPNVTFGGPVYVATHGVTFDVAPSSTPETFDGGSARTTTTGSILTDPF